MKRILLFGALALHLNPTEASACGGFFCSTSPVLQTAERVVFELNEDSMNVYVQLQYQGDDRDFAWVIPVPEVPEVEVGVGQAMFDALERQTAPRFVGFASATPAQAIEPINVGCGAPLSKPSLSATFIPPPDVEVHQNETIGPYDVAVLDARSAEELNNWLRINGYQVVPGSESIVQQYLDDGMKLMALKLTNEAGADAVEPVKLTFKTSNTPMIPVKLTAIAAVPGLEIVTWIFGSGRVVPKNFAEVEIDPSMLSSADDYDRVLAEQVDAQAGGHGFVTEFAQPSTVLSADGSTLLARLLERHSYVTRMRTELDPGEMTADPVFEVDASREDVSNEIELSGVLGLSSASLLSLLAIGVLLIGRRR